MSTKDHRRLRYAPALIGGVVSLVWWFLAFVESSDESPNGFRGYVGIPILIFLAGFTPSFVLTSHALKKTSSGWISWLFVGITYGAFSGFLSGTLCGIITLTLASPVQNAFDIPNILTRASNIMIEAAIFGSPIGSLIGGLAGGLIAVTIKSLRGPLSPPLDEGSHE